MTPEEHKLYATTFSTSAPHPYYISFVNAALKQQLAPIEVPFHPLISVLELKQLANYYARQGWDANFNSSEKTLILRYPK